jgi:serine/threonine-protein phosphatase 2A regulatory subunit B
LPPILISFYFDQVQEKKIKKICNFNIEPQKATINGLISSSDVPTSSKTCFTNGGSVNNPLNCRSSSLPFGGTTSLHLPMVLLSAWLLICNYYLLISTSNRHLQVTSHETSLLAKCRRTYAHAHDYHINSISNNRCAPIFNH